MFLIELHKTTNKYLNITLTYCEKILHQNMCRQCPIQDKVIFNGNLYSSFIINLLNTFHAEQRPFIILDLTRFVSSIQPHENHSVNN